MRSAKDFFKPKALGAPLPPREIPFRPARMIHFFDPSNPRMASKIPDIAKKVDILLANLEDAIEATNKLAAREGLIKIGRETNFGETQFWTRVNSLDSPWALDDLLRIVPEVGDKLDVIMMPRSGAPGTSTTPPGCSRSPRPKGGSPARSSCTRSWRPRSASPMSKRSWPPAPACRA